MTINWTEETLNWPDPPRETKPRGGGGGHVISGLFYVGFGIVMLGLSLKRAREHTLCFPERNMETLRKMSIGAVASGVLGIYIHGVAGNKTDSFFHYLGHLATFFSFLVAGIVGILESYRLVPIDTFRKLVGLSFFLVYMIFRDHAQFQPGAMGDAHALLAQINLATAFSIAYSVLVPSNLEAGVAVYVLILLQGIWVWTISYLFFAFGDPDHLYKDVSQWPMRDHVVPLFTFEVCGMVLLCYIIAVVFGRGGFWSIQTALDSETYTTIQTLENGIERSKTGPLETETSCCE